MMKTSFKATGSVMLTDELQTYATERLDRVDKLLDQNDSSIRAEVELATVSGSRTGDMYRAEVNLSFAGGFIRAEATGDTMHAAIDECTDELRQEVKKHRAKNRDLMRRGALKVKEIFRYFRGS